MLEKPQLKPTLRWLVCAGIVVLFFGVPACSSTAPPKNTVDACRIFYEKRSWYRSALRAETRWNIDVPTLLAVINQESSFDGDARPPRKRFLFVFPGKRLSNAYGYAQAKEETWSDYEKRSGNRRASRDKFKDAVDFVGWYLDTMAKHGGIPRSSAKNLYLAYHEGLNGFKRGTWRKKEWLINVAERVQQRSNQYRRSLLACKNGPARRYKNR